ncbi:transposase family protein [Streptomyces lasiicapitis]|uniref:transposase family protein n=1 Tax=Streptomyces lasiicapitis TaxID=1923961 RepID=UPI0036CF0D70
MSPAAVGSKINSRWRRMAPGRIVVIVLAVLRRDQRIADMAGGNQVGDTTVRRWRDELISLLAAHAPRLDRACKRIAKRGGEAVLIDGTLIPTVRRTGRANRPNYSGKHRRHGLHFLALTDEKGRLVWISAARPGRTHDITAARRDHILTHLRTPPGSAPWPTSASLDLDDNPDHPVIVTGYKATRARKLTPGDREVNRVLAAARAPPVEHGFGHLKTWRILTKLRTDPTRATDLLRALLVLTNLEVNR